jgi:hypothetical protein
VSSGRTTPAGRVSAAGKAAARVAEKAAGEMEAVARVAARAEEAMVAAVTAGGTAAGAMVEVVTAVAMEVEGMAEEGRAVAREVETVAVETVEVTAVHPPPRRHSSAHHTAQFLPDTHISTVLHQWPQRAGYQAAREHTPPMSKASGHPNHSRYNGRLRARCVCTDERRTSCNAQTLLTTWHFSSSRHGWRSRKHRTQD